MLISLSLHMSVVTVTFSLQPSPLPFAFTFPLHDLNSAALSLILVVLRRFAFDRTVSLCHVTTLTEAIESPAPCLSMKTNNVKCFAYYFRFFILISFQSYLFDVRPRIEIRFHTFSSCVS